MPDNDRALTGGLIARISGGVANRVLELLNPDALLDHIDVERLIERVDVNDLLEQVDVNRLLDRVDPNQMLDRVEVNDLLDRVDPDRLLDRVDANRLLDRVDPDRLLDRVDVDGIVKRAGIADIVAQSTGRFADSAIDLFRRQLAGLDSIVYRTVQRIIRRDPKELPTGPTSLQNLGPMTQQTDRRVVSGHFAGPVSRALAAALDVSASGALFALASAATAWVAQTMLGLEMTADHVGWVWVAVFGLWLFLYYWTGLALVGKTPGKAVVGLRVVARDGSPLIPGRAALRVIFMPASFALFGIGLLGAFVGRERRTLHDAIAGTVVVYEWGGRSAELPTFISMWLDRRAHFDDSAPATEEDVLEPSGDEGPGSGRRSMPES